MRLGGKEHGQALIETAITLPVIFTLLLGYLAVLIRIEAQVEIDTATSLAAAACASAPAGSTTCGDWAQATFQGTLQQYSYIKAPTLSNCPIEQAQIQCNAQATLDYTKTPMAYVIPFPITINSSATSFGSPYRSQ
jgi:Flp pilus assembly protein TadG